MHFGFTIFYQERDLTLESLSDSHKGLRYLSKNKKGVFNFQYLKNDRFEEDKLFFENVDYIAGIDGVVLNRVALENEYHTSSWKSLFLTLYKTHKYQIASKLVGEFSGFIFDKKNESLFFFGNQTGSKRAYYHHAASSFILAPSLKIISKFLRQRNQSIALNRDAAYSLLTTGGMLGNSTLVDGVFRILGGEYLVLTTQRLSLHKYLDYNAIETKQDSKAQFIDRLDHQFTTALKLEYEKDLGSSYPPLATLSGGLDSRMNVFIAHKTGYKVDNFCFSQSGYDDEIIAQSIAQHLNQSFTFVPLDGGDYIFDFEENMNFYEGQMYYTASAHFNYAIKKLSQPLGLIHTGLIGDGLLGTFIKRREGGPPDIPSKLLSQKLYPKIKTQLDDLAKEFVSGEVFNLFQRGFNVAISGAWAMEHRAYVVAPFLHPEFIKTCISIPSEFKYQQNIYIQWINKHHKELTHFKWETIGMKPKYTWQIPLSRFPKKAKSIWHRLNGTSHKLSMTPYDYWTKNNPNILSFMESILNNKIHLLEADQDLQKDVRDLFHQGNMVEKILAITLLGGIELLKIKI